MAIKNPTPQTEQLYLKSVNESVDLYDKLVDQAARGPVPLANKDFDTGEPTKPGEYRLSDEAYAFTVHQLAQHKFNSLTPDLRAELLRFYADANTNTKLATKRKKKDWEELQKDLAELKATPATDSTAKATE